jgi:hypothetical protein
MKEKLGTSYLSSKDAQQISIEKVFAKLKSSPQRHYLKDSNEENI